MPGLGIPPPLSPIPDRVFLRYISQPAGNDTNSPSEPVESERPKKSEMPRRHTHDHPPFLGGIPIDWSTGHLEWHHNGCNCAIKFCPRHGRELRVLRPREPSGRSTRRRSRRIQESVPYHVRASDEEKIPNHVEDDHNVDYAPEGEDGQVDYDADDEASTGRSCADQDDKNAMPSPASVALQPATGDPGNPSVLRSIEGVQQTGSASPTLSAVHKDTVQYDPEATISVNPHNRGATEIAASCDKQDQAHGNDGNDSNENGLSDLDPQFPEPPPQILHVRRPDQPPPVTLVTDAAYHASLSHELRDKMMTWLLARSEEFRAFIQREQAEAEAAAPEPPASMASRADSEAEAPDGEAPDGEAGAGPGAGPPRLPDPDPYSVPSDSAADSVHNRNRPLYQKNRRLGREIRHLAREAGSLQGSESLASPRPTQQEQQTSGFLAMVLDRSPSLAPVPDAARHSVSARVSGPARSDSARPSTGRASGSSQSLRGRGGSANSVRNVSHDIPAQSAPSPPMEFFLASNPKPVARRLFSRSAPSQNPPQQLGQPRPTNITQSSQQRPTSAASYANQPTKVPVKDVSLLSSPPSSSVSSAAAVTGSSPANNTHAGATPGPSTHRRTRGKNANAPVYNEAISSGTSASSKLTSKGDTVPHRRKRNEQAVLAQQAAAHGKTCTEDAAGNQMSSVKPAANQGQETDKNTSNNEPTANGGRNRTRSLSNTTGAVETGGERSGRMVTRSQAGHGGPRAVGGAGDEERDQQGKQEADDEDTPKSNRGRTKRSGSAVTYGQGGKRRKV
ncbi:hypothetical protein QBC32DRAFT_318362 [Pseudoneurospora amorphoporcata]|uniref:Uncharacterized protein n=1 Tax=Pseudoneurospora amorphoporcata TaxID=241081 RepID=A0AAN6NL74_9PEZI|nr:hypothetical protein QBC32DRAFT_318362 [Pseudoneurospora amorphoporcata]